MNQDKIKNVAELIRQADTFLVTVNLDAGSSPEHLNGKCLTINEDLFYFLQKLRGQIQ